MFLLFLKTQQSPHQVTAFIDSISDFISVCKVDFELVTRQESVYTSDLYVCGVYAPYIPYITQK